jgi:hypothetical protein
LYFNYSLLIVKADITGTPHAAWQDGGCAVETPWLQPWKAERAAMMHKIT